MPDKNNAQPMTAYLLSRGWKRSDEPAAYVGECGASSDTVGYCEKPARWCKGGTGFMCAQHAAQRQRFDESFPIPSFPEESA